MYTLKSKFSGFGFQSNEHFDSGKYKLIKTILHLKIAELRNDGLSTNYLAPLQARYYNSDQYFERFLPLLEEECKTIVKEGLAQVDTGKTIKSSLKLRECKLAKAIDNPSLLIMDGMLPDDLETTQAVVVLLQSDYGHELLGITSGNEQGDFHEQLRIKILLDQNLRNNTNALFRQGTNWNIYVLGSVLSQIRAYEACTQKPIVPFLQDCISATSNNQPFFPFPSQQEQILLARLNSIQQKAIMDFVDLPQGLQLLQGPPGSGKTTTIVTLLEILCLQKQQRILVCAPSNKAVQVLAKRFLQTCPHIAAALAGVEKKVAPELQDIFIHTWGKQIQTKLRKITSEIDFLLQQGKGITLSEASKRIERIRLAYQNILQKITSSLPSLVTNQQLIVNQLATNYLKLLANTEIQAQSQYSVIRSSTPLENLMEIIHKIEGSISQASRNKENNLELQLLNNATVIFTTLSVAGRDTLKKMHPVNILVVDEAAQAIEAETLIPFQHQPKKCLLVGDTKQLPALVKSDRAIAGNLNWSMMWRLMEENAYPYEMLTVQYRMQPEIRTWPSQQYYNDRLEDGGNIRERILPKLSAIFLPYAFINIDAVESSQNFSYKNEKEADYIIRILQHLKANHNIEVEKQVGIITFYAGQVELIQNKLRQKHLAKVLVNSVDGYQGDECDFIIISFVRANTRNSIGFLTDFRRLNVAVTRAKLSLIMLGNSATLNSATSDIKLMLTDAKKRNCLFEEQQLLEELKPRHKNKILDKMDTRPILKGKSKLFSGQPSLVKTFNKPFTRQKEDSVQLSKSNQLFNKPKLTNTFPMAKIHYDKGWEEESLGRKCKAAEQKAVHYHNAISHYSEAIKIHPNYPHALHNRGYVKAELAVLTKQAHGLREAILDYDAAIALKRDFAKAYTNRGWCKGELGQLTQDKNQYLQAIEDLNKAIELEPDNIAAYKYRAWNKQKAGLNGSEDREMAAQLKSQKSSSKNNELNQEQQNSGASAISKAARPSF